MTVSDVAWVDSGAFRPNRGQFPIRVERHVNSFVGGHLPGVTTVTTATRYYALHGLVARISQAESLNEAATLDLLRRCEALLACVTKSHDGDPSHNRLTPSPHGIDAIVRSAWTADGVDIVQAADVYSIAKWAYANTYRGSELTLRILAPGGLQPGPWYDDARARSALGPLVDAARSDTRFSHDELAGLKAACLCTTAESADGAWLAELLSGEAGQPVGRPTMGNLLWQFGRITAVTISTGPTSAAAELMDRIMFDPVLASHPSLGGLVALPRWRGALLRRESVYAWRLIWHNLSRLVEGARPVSDLITAFADQLPETSLTAFRSNLPARLDQDGHARRAEREVAELPELQRWLARLILGADRLGELDPDELIGFRGADEHRRGVWEELSPGWVASRLDAHAGRSVRDLGHAIATTLIARSQRVALQKSYFDPRRQQLSFPARLHVRDGIAVQVFPETAPAPATRIPQYLSIVTQAGMLTMGSDGALTMGPNGGRLG